MSFFPQKLQFFQAQTFDSQTAFNNIYFCRFKNSENVPIHLLLSNLVRGLALDPRAARQLGHRRTKVKAVIKYEVKITLGQDPSASGPQAR